MKFLVKKQKQERFVVGLLFIDFENPWTDCRSKEICYVNVDKLPVSCENGQFVLFETKENLMLEMKSKKEKLFNPIVICTITFLSAVGMGWILLELRSFNNTVVQTRENYA